MDLLILFNKKLKIKKLTAIYLLELIMSMLIISISLTSVVMTSYIINKVPNKTYLKQATQIANNYLNEIFGKDFPTTIPCPVIVNNDPCNTLQITDALKAICQTTSANRSNYQNICQYDNLINYGAKDITGNPIAGLENFMITVNIITSQEAILDNLTGGSDINTANVLRIDVNVSGTAMEKVSLSSYKSKYL